MKVSHLSVCMMKCDVETLASDSPGSVHCDCETQSESVSDCDTGERVVCVCVGGWAAGVGGLGGHCARGEFGWHIRPRR